MLPDFILVGGMKCGTTSLAQQIHSHPEIFMPDIKEPQFFSIEDRWSRGREWYEGLFAGAEGAKAVGEASTTYTMYPVVQRVPQRMASLIPNARLLYMVRDPIDRLMSHYMHEWYAGRLNVELPVAVESDRRLVDYGRYYYQIEQFLPYFPADRWQVLLFEDFKENPRATSRVVYTFLGVDAQHVPPDLGAKNVTADKVRWPLWLRAARQMGFAARAAKAILPNRFVDRLRRTGCTREKPQLSGELRARLVQEFQPDVEALSDFVGRDLRKVWRMTGA